MSAYLTVKSILILFFCAIQTFKVSEISESVFMVLLFHDSHLYHTQQPSDPHISTVLREALQTTILMAATFAHGEFIR